MFINFSYVKERSEISFFWPCFNSYFCRLFIKWNAISSRNVVYSEERVFIQLLSAVNYFVVYDVLYHIMIDNLLLTPV